MPEGSDQANRPSGIEVLDAGDQAFTLSLGDRIDPALIAAVVALDRRIGALAESTGLPGLIETVPTFRSLTVIYDPLLTTREQLLDVLAPVLQAPTNATGTPVDGRRWRLPVCYGGACGSDLASVAATVGLDPDGVIALHQGGDYRVYMLGFLPGFPFIGDVAAPLCLPRRREPRPRVPPGSVAIAGGLTAVYPSASPGGWHLLGRCPVPLFDVGDAQPSLLQAGDQVRFVAVDETEFARIENAFKAGELERQTFSAEWANG